MMEGEAKITTEIETFYPSEIIEIDSVRPHPRNYNEHDGEQIDQLGNSLRQFGQFKNIVVWREYIVAGHGLVEAARARGWRRIDVKRLPGEWSEARVNAVLVADNRLAQLSIANEALLADLLQDVRVEDADLLSAVGYSSDELDNLLRQLGAEGEPVGINTEEARKTLHEQFLVPPFSILDARQGYWQERKKAWLALGIQSELGRGDRDCVEISLN